MSVTERETSLKDDLLVGAKAAADYVGVSPRIIYDLVEKGALPVVKLGDSKNARLFFRKHILDAKFMPPEAA